MANIPAQAEAEFEQVEHYNAADPKQVNTARKKEARKERERLEVVEALMQNKKTRVWLYNILEKCHMFGNPIIPGDTHSTYFNLGEQNVGKLLLLDAMKFPTEYVIMMAEGKDQK